MNEKQTFINSADDMEWLRETHLTNLHVESFNSAIIYGNEDSPVKVDLYLDQNPNVTDLPLTILL
ncbi:MAG TPA: hypothetical protein VLG09_00105 [Candidatus Saccharimonadales bacterium]|nr:hypothetical protein [Candidatus Saccharimonadales bacterium]